MGNYSGDIDLTFKMYGTVSPDVHEFFVANRLSVLLNWPGAVADTVCEPEPAAFGRILIYFTATELPSVPAFQRLLAIEDLREFNIWYSSSDMTERGEFHWEYSERSKESEFVVWTHLQEAIKRQTLLSRTVKAFDEYELEELYHKYRDVDRIEIPLRNPHDPSFNTIMTELQRHRRYL